MIVVQQDGSVGESDNHQAWGTEFDPWDPRDRRRERTSTSYPLTCTSILWYAPQKHTHTNTNVIKIVLNTCKMMFVYFTHSLSPAFKRTCDTYVQGYVWVWANARHTTHTETRGQPRTPVALLQRGVLWCFAPGSATLTGLRVSRHSLSPT